MKKHRKLIYLAVCLCLVTALIGCSSNSNNKTNSNNNKGTDTNTANNGNTANTGNNANSTEPAANNSEQPPAEPLEYSVFFGTTSPITVVDNPNDVVTPYIEQKFNIKVKDIIQPQDGVLPKERLNMLIAAGDVPDVVVVDMSFAPYLMSTGLYTDDMTSYMAEMPNFKKYYPDENLKFIRLNGKNPGIPYVGNTSLVNEIAKDDPYHVDSFAWSLWAREDLLSKAGYTFTPMADLQKNILDKGQKLTKADMKIEPPIETADQWQEMLGKIKALDQKVGDKAVIPMSGVSWNQFHWGAMDGIMMWGTHADGTVTGWIDNPAFKNWYKRLWGMYKDGLVDRDFIIQKDDQLQSKIASGQVASGMFIPDENAAVASLHQNIGPEANIRYIPWPKTDPNEGFIDVDTGGSWIMLFKKDFKDLKRLTQYFDWFYTDEAMDLMTWGPESAGLYEEVDGKKMYKDPELADAVMNGGAKPGTKGPDYYGLSGGYGVPGSLSFAPNRAAQTAPTGSYNKSDPRKNYNVPVDIRYAMRAIAGDSELDKTGRTASSDGTELTNQASSYFWGKFQNDRVGKIFAAKTADDFEKAFEEQKKIFFKETHFEEALEAMKTYFANFK